MKKNLSIIFLLFYALNALSQVSVESKVDTIEILIGEQTNLELTVTAKKGSKIQFPIFRPSQNVVKGVEVLSSQMPDTTELENNFWKVVKRYTITSFDEKLYYLPPLNVKVDGKGYQSKSLALKVLTVAVDTLHPNQFFPPKDVQRNPFLWSEWSSLFWLSLLLLILFLLGSYFFVILNNHKPISIRIRMVKRILPHQKAMQEIERIKAKKMVISENPKEYYTKLTDAIRTYINERFGFNAMEMTSSEIIEHLRQNENKKMLDELNSLFETADLVKFAKYSTLINENDLNLVNAVNFINSTKMENEPTVEKIVPTLSDKDKKSVKIRLKIKVLLIAIIIVVVLLLLYLLYNATMLLI
jgi:hypothetical protein